MVEFKAKRIASLLLPTQQIACLSWENILIIREYTAKDTCGRNRLYAEVECQICTGRFHRQKRQLNSSFHCCSAMCLSLAKGSAVELVCDHCASPFVRAKSKLHLSKSGKYFCSRECKDSAQKYMVEIQPEHYGVVNGQSSYREKAFRHYKPLCTRCSYSNVLALEVHHKDRNRENNDILNLEILCANCHTIEHKRAYEEDFGQSLQDCTAGGGIP